MKIGQTGSFQSIFHSIPARIVWVTSIRNTRREILGWKAHCENCHSEQTFTPAQHAEACEFRLTHVCFKGKKKVTVVPARQSNLHSERVGTLGR